MIAYPLAVGTTITRVFSAGHSGPVLVLVHGLTSRADRWQHNIDVLAAAGYRVLAPDLPGHGFATKSADFDHSIPGYRDFLLQFLDQVDAPEAILLGTSLGGHVAAAAAIAAPARVRSLIMVGSLGLAPVTQEKVERTTAGLRDMRLEAMRNRLLQVFSDPRHVTDALVEEDVRINASPGAAACFERFLDYFAHRFNDDLVLDGLQALGDRIPLLLLWGEEDKSVPLEIGLKTRRHLPQARLGIFQKTNHTPYWEAPALFNQAVLDFLAGRMTQTTASWG
ncbi:alpha/beta fold hydrolase [Vineibacter terrae]|uniref:alpha/beta fold hydrolase n=1 Tax=Vineibacter terrae TaxID=2586908 RepID=UPI002E33C562|nr:alpha/beta fold hydrolase [Vineibacter terrae]HEX2887292.1 alpha/beta fold hydrolase [Vineibacter terrae]